MTRFDRYMLSQLMVMFGFFALVLVSIFWLNQAVRMFDRLIGDGQPAWVFVEFTLLTLPKVIGVVLPLAAFAASVQVVNRLSTESELTVMQATGYSPLRLARPVLVFGLLVAAMMSLLAHVLIPASDGQLKLRQNEVTQNVTAKLLTEGEFLHPVPGVTFYIREISPDGELRDVFLSDQRDAGRPIIFTSSLAYLVQQEDGTQLVMVAGLAQTLQRGANRLFTTHFDDFSYDISALVRPDAANLDRIEFASTADLILRPAAVAARTGASPGALASELHARFAQALLCLIAALVGFAALVVGSYSRFGVWRQILLALGLLVSLKMIEGVVIAPVLGHAALWPLIYLPSLAGLVIAALLLALAGRPGLLHRLARRRHRGVAP